MKKALLLLVSLMCFGGWAAGQTQSCDPAYVTNNTAYWPCLFYQGPSTQFTISRDYDVTMQAGGRWAIGSLGINMGTGTPGALQAFTMQFDVAVCNADCSIRTQVGTLSFTGAGSGTVNLGVTYSPGLRLVVHQTAIVDDANAECFAFNYSCTMHVLFSLQ